VNASNRELEEAERKPMCALFFPVFKNVLTGCMSKSPVLLQAGTKSLECSGESSSKNQCFRNGWQFVLKRLFFFLLLMTVQI